MLTWLDAAASRKAHPNENYAREVMELFTLGRGHYTEKDVQEAARAFTGAFVQGGRFSLRPRPARRRREDDPRPDRAVPAATTSPALLLDQPSCAEFLCRKLFRLFVSEVDDALARPDRPAGRRLPRLGLRRPRSRSR